MKEEKVWFENSKGKKICGLMCIQDNAPAILMVHGVMPRTDKHEFGEFDKIAPKLHEAGYSTLRFDFNGHGETEGDHVDVSIENYKDDMKSALDFLFKQNINKDKVGVFTNSFGGVVAILSNDERIKAFVLNSTPTPSDDDIENVFRDANPNWKEEVKEKGYFIYTKRKISEENRKKVGMHIYNFAKTSDLKKDIKKINKPLLILCAELDEFVSVDSLKKLFEAANEPKKFIFMKDTRHCCTDKIEDLIKSTLDFFNKWVK